MTADSTERFGRLLVELVRDKAIRNCRARIQSGTKSAIGKAWANAISSRNPESITDTVVIDCVDDAVFFLLNAIDDGTLPISLREADGNSANLTEEGHGELAGWYMGSDNWRERYSTEPFNNYPTRVE